MHQTGIVHSMPGFNLSLNIPVAIFVELANYTVLSAGAVQVPILKTISHNLQKRPKNVLQKRNFAVGDLVIITDQKTSRSHYPLGRFIKVEPEKSHGVEVVRRAVLLYT